MRDCDAVEKHISLFDSDEHPPPDGDMLEHVRTCEHCRRELASVHCAAAGVLLHSFDDESDDDHLSDLDLAVFASHGLDAPNADEAVEHLANCRSCREQFSNVRRLLEQHEELIYGEVPRARMPDRSFLDQVRILLSDPARLFRGLGGFLAWVMEWAMLLIVLFQFAAGYLAAPAEIGRSRATEILGVVPRDDLRFWLIATTCIILAILFRWLGAQLYHAAVSQDRH
ncbi:MAG: hypothetical protein GF393_02140 [Armatimonadia bacterium]|nr:hypothetical protein [Armatimonadia bacterium]